MWKLSVKLFHSTPPPGRVYSFSFVKNISLLFTCGKRDVHRWPPNSYWRKLQSMWGRFLIYGVGWSGGSRYVLRASLAYEVSKIHVLHKSGSDKSHINSCPLRTSLIMGHYTYCQKEISHSGWVYEAENESTLIDSLLFGPNSIWWRPKGEMANTWISRSLSQENWPSITVTQLQCQQKWVAADHNDDSVKYPSNCKMNEKCFVLVSSSWDIFCKFNPHNEICYHPTAIEMNSTSLHKNQ